MSEAPERIWLNCTPDGIDMEWYGAPDDRPDDKQPPWPEVEYVRADLVERLKGEPEPAPVIADYPPGVG